MVTHAGAARLALGAPAPEGGPEPVHGALARIEEVGRGAMDDLDRVLNLLAGSDQSDDGAVGLAGSLRSLVAALPPGLTVDLDVPEPVGRPSEARLDRAAAETLRRVVQESLTNVIRHAGPDTHVRITLTVDATHAEVDVVDDGARASAAPTLSTIPPSRRSPMRSSCGPGFG